MLLWIVVINKYFGTVPASTARFKRKQRTILANNSLEAELSWQVQELLHVQMSCCREFWAHVTETRLHFVHCHLSWDRNGSFSTFIISHFYLKESFIELFVNEVGKMGISRFAWRKSTDRWKLSFASRSNSKSKTGGYWHKNIFHILHLHQSEGNISLI